ncbi:trypsin-like serine peptidase [Amycolatopsis anabasis]|uniref:trypsin-like serine peptidase n=1 Tax=Amycolatopsis anabasis TaxID=1840409 RepID=UPI00131DACEA|nr:serine protease [Amycolatopsis anabasis]
MRGLLVVCLLVLATLVATADVPAVSGAAAPETARFEVTPVGALFDWDDGELGEHYCTGSVVDSPAGNLIVTAAHCLDSSAAEDIAFVPGYHNGMAPYGIWTASQVIVDPRWSAAADPDFDIGFVVVGQAGNPRPIEAVTGANRLATGRGFVNDVTLTGYPDDTDTPLIAHGRTTAADDHQIKVDSPGFEDGTSGSPWVLPGEPGTVIGVVGGYQLGGDEPDISYSTYFDDEIANLYRLATSTS